MSIELLSKAVAAFTAELDKTPDSDWSKPTKCDGWDVTGLMQHIVGGAISSTAGLRGTPREETLPIFGGFRFGSDPRAEYTAAVADHVAAFKEIADLDAVVQHPLMDMPASRMLMFRIVDFTLHAWDLGAGMGREVVLDPALVEFAWANLSPMAAGIGSTGMFGAGPSGDVPESADLQTRLIDLTGRR